MQPNTLWQTMVNGVLCWIFQYKVNYNFDQTKVYAIGILWINTWSDPDQFLKAIQTFTFFISNEMIAVSREFSSNLNGISISMKNRGPKFRLIQFWTIARLLVTRVTFFSFLHCCILYSLLLLLLLIIIYFTWKAAYALNSEYLSEKNAI